MAFACIPASTAKPRGCRRRRRHREQLTSREQLRRGLLNTDPGSAALKPAAMARPQVGSTPEVATAAAGSASRLLYKYKRLLTALGPQRVTGGKTLSEYMFSELLLTADIGACSRGP